jgi:hypothetical protein
MNKLFRFVCLHAAVACLVWVSTVRADVTIVDNGVSRAPIIVFPDAPTITRKSAEELADYIQKISGARPQVLDKLPDPVPASAIWVGVQPKVRELFPKVNFDFKHAEEILIVVDDRHVVIAGRDRWDPRFVNEPVGPRKVVGVQSEYGTANAIYTFIQEQLGVRWLWPGDLGEDVPPSKTIRVATMEYRYHPQLRFRSGLLRFSALNYPSYGMSQDWCRRQRTQLDSFYGEAPGLTNWWDLYHEKYPDFFALQPDGTRSGFPKPHNAKLCVSNPGVWDLWMVKVEEELKKDPLQTVFSAAPADGYRSGHCVCENCRAWDNPAAEKRWVNWQGQGQEWPALSDRYVTFANKVAAKLKERYPDRDYFVYTQAYGNTRPAPMSVVPADNVLVSNAANMFLIGTNRVDPDSPTGKTSAELYADWGKLTRNQIWRPNTGSPAGWFQALPDVPFTRLADSLKFVSENGCMGIFVDLVWEHWATQGPLYYMATQLTWNPKLDWRAVMDDYYQRGFGPAAPHIKAFWTALEDARNRKVDLFPEEADGFTEIYDKAFFQKIGALLDQADAAVANQPPVYRQRVAFVRVAYDYTSLMIKARRQFLAAAADTDNPELRQKLVETWGEIDKFKAANPTALNWRPIRPGTRRMNRAGGLFHPDHLPKAGDPAARTRGGKATGEALTDRELTDAEKAGWKLAMQDTFDQGSLEQRWQIIDGTWKLDGGDLVGSGTLLSVQTFPEGDNVGFHRVEFEVVSEAPPAVAHDGQAAPAPVVSDMDVALQAQALGEQKASPIASGYFLQFGGFMNTRNQIRRARAVLVADMKPTVLIEPGKVHKIVAENDGGDVRLYVNGKQVLAGRDPSPLLGPEHNRVGFYFMTNVRLHVVKVYVKRLANDLDLD